MILSAWRTTKRLAAQPAQPVARSGLSYQRKFSQAFDDSTPPGYIIEREPWFEYRDSKSDKSMVCSPDLLAIDGEEGFVIVVEIKRTWVPGAIDKLRQTYCPVVSIALGLPTRPLVVCKTLSPGCPRPSPTISFALISDDPVFHWLGRGSIEW